MLWLGYGYIGLDICIMTWIVVVLTTTIQVMYYAQKTTLIFLIKIKFQSINDRTA